MRAFAFKFFKLLHVQHQAMFGQEFNIQYISYRLAGRSGVDAEVFLHPTTSFLKSLEGAKSDEEFLLRDEILDTLSAATVPLKADVIAKRMKRKNTSYFRQVLSDLVQDKEIESTNAGYVIVKRPDNRQTPDNENESGSNDAGK